MKSEHYFYASNGAVLTSKEDLLAFLKKVDEQTWQNHVNSERNDFANWTRDILKNKKLAVKLQKSQDKNDILHTLEKSLKKPKEKRPKKKDIITQLVNAIHYGKRKKH